MTYSYRVPATITFVRDDGTPGPGESRVYSPSDKWKVSIQDEGCVELMNFGEPSVTVIVPWWRIWEIRV